jgi:hypothetical protein
MRSGTTWACLMISFKFRARTKVLVLTPSKWIVPTSTESWIMLESRTDGQLVGLKTLLLTSLKRNPFAWKLYKRWQLMKDWRRNKNILYIKFLFCCSKYIFLCYFHLNLFLPWFDSKKINCNSIDWFLDNVCLKNR